jgi:hypothetical protein
MSPTRSFTLATAAAAVLAVTSPAHALEQAWSFSQAGFSGGGTVQGHFVVDDLNNDGVATSFYGELVSFSMSFSGDAFVPDFSIGLEELGALNWRIGSAGLGDEVLRRMSEGLISDTTLDLPFSYVSGLGPTHTVGGYAVDLARGLASVTQQAVAVSAVPEPSAFALMGAGIGVLSFLARRRRVG